jgi:glycine betaine/proline transport system substrate-binding protein
MDTVINDVMILLDCNESLFKLQDDSVQKLDSIPPTVSRTAKFVLKPLECIHKEFVDATITYRDQKWKKHVTTMEPKEIHCQSPFLRPRPMMVAEFHDLFSKGHYTETCLNLEGADVDETVHILMQTCTNRLHKVEERLVESGKILYLSSEAISENAYYLLSVVIKKNEGMTKVMAGAVSDKPYGLQSFLHDIVSDLIPHMSNVKGAKEVSVIRKEQVTNFFIGGDGVFVRSPISMGSTKASLEMQDAVFVRSEIGSTLVSADTHGSIVARNAIKAGDELKAGFGLSSTPAVTSEAYLELGTAEFKSGNFEAAIECYDKALEIKPKYDNAWYNKGTTLDNLGRHEEAIVCYDRALEIKPKYVNAWHNKGSTLDNLGRHEEAIVCYDKALEIDPKYVDAWHNKGIALDELGKHEKAIECYDKALEIDPKYVNAWNAKGQALNKLGRHLEALECTDVVGRPKFKSNGKGPMTTDEIEQYSASSSVLLTAMLSVIPEINEKNAKQKKEENKHSLLGRFKNIFPSKEKD